MSTVTTAAETMPTLREIEQGLRERLAEVSRVRDGEATKRERAKAKVTEVAHQRGNVNGIGASLDDLLAELGLPTRPLRISRTVQVEFRQEFPARHMRDLRLPNHDLPHNAYGDVQQAWLGHTARVSYEVTVERDGDGCGCDLPVEQRHLGTPPEGVTLVSVTPWSCSMPNNDTMTPHPCRSQRERAAAGMAAAHDDPLIQPCTHGHRYTNPHRHLYYPDGSVTYAVRPDFENPDATAVPGWYVVGDLVGTPVPGTVVDPDPDDDMMRVQQCDIVTHPAHAIHIHVQFTNLDPDHIPSYSRDLHYEVQGDEAVLPGRFCRDADRVGALIAADDDD